MPVVLDPIGYAAGVTEDCTSQSLIQPTISVDLVGRRLIIFIKTQTVTINSGQCATIDWIMRNREGNAVDLAACLSGGTNTVKFRMSDGLSGSLTADSENAATATVVSSSDGHVRVDIEAADVSHAGIFLGEFALIQPDGCTIFSNRMYVSVQGGLFSDGKITGPPTAAEVRLFLRDYQQENELLDTVDFDDSEIALATYLPIQFWNEIPPFIGTYDTRNFPYRYHWLIGICAHLYSIAAEHHRRNRFPYNAGGMQIDDKGKSGEYEQKSAQMMQEFKAFAQRRKVASNLERFYGEVSSPYNSTRW